MASIEQIERKHPTDTRREEIQPGSLRRIGEHGPVYEVTAVLDADTLEICVIGQEERSRYPVSEFLADPEE